MYGIKTNIGSTYAYHKNELYHHGIEGQEWGERNGPPYPLDPEDHSTAEKKAVKSDSKKSHASLTDKQKKYVKNGAKLVAVALAIAGGVYLEDLLNL